MQAGQLDRQIKLLAYATATDNAGGIAETHTEYATVWASVKDLRGLQFIAAQQTNSAITTSFRIRHRTDIKARDRIEWKGRQFDIVGQPAEIGRNEFLDIMATARDNL